ncbi:hypothetical protein [Sorangium cellulosum]|uniref:Uncharacterized protein n=1 Tax=Sorangium cellulosum TaxID=56 RepID=A0A150QA29_SORCE|nr:hypothetical protein [Sorangium cellulosum]KYF64845.1 hypothetical protein BE15_21685 [Sorangium cellulosum]
MSTQVAEDLNTILEKLSEHARRTLTALGVQIEEAGRVDEPTLRDTLRKKGLPELDAAIQFHRDVGGLSVPALSLTFATARRVAHGPTRSTPDGEVAIPIGRSGGAAYFIDARGVLYRMRDAPRDKELTPVAADPWTLLEKISLLATVEPLAKGALCLRLRPYVGAALAGALGAEPAVEATDSFHRFFRRGSLVIVDGHPLRDEGERDTLVWTPTLEDAVAALRAAGSACGATGAELTTAGAELRIEPRRSAPEPPSPEVLREDGAVALLAGAGEEGTSGHVWAPPGPPRLEQTRLFAGTLLSWETVDDQGARTRDFTGAEDSLSPLLTPRAVRGLLRLGARVDPRRKGERASLERLLSCWELPAHEAALDFEARLGGLRFANVQWGPFGIVGAWPDRPAATEAASVDEGQLVPIGAEILGSVSYAVDAEGTVHLEDEHLEPTPIAVSWPVCLERLGAASADEGELPCSCRIKARVGLAVAAALNAAPVPEGTDQHASMWYRDGISVLEVAADPYNREPQTAVAARREGDLVIALQVALQVAPDAAVEVFGVKGDPSPPAPEEPVVARARVWGNTWDKAQRELCIYGGPERYRFVWR